MREIKFRAYDTHTKIMLPVVDIIKFTKSEDIYITRDGAYGVGINMQYQPHIELMQYIGLKDKNGTEIYEGDIVKHNGFYEGDCYYNAGCGQVLWDDEDTGFYLTAKDTSFISLFDLTRNLDGEVIGNIYENPDLLKGADNIE